MMPQYHLLASTIIATALLILTKSPTASLLCLLTGFLLDTDHLIDYWLYKKKITLDKGILQGFYEKWNKIPIIFHSIELLIPITLLSLLYPSLSTILLGTAIGLTSHLILDFTNYELHPLSYFLTYRIIKKFDKKYICTKHE